MEPLSPRCNRGRAKELDVPIEEIGYIYIYVANESKENVDVYFDDMEVQLIDAPVTSASDYYPFGMAMEGRSYTSEKYRFGYQGQFAEMDGETGWNAFELRMYASVIGRWMMPDPKRQYFSPYLAFGNNPIYKVDPDGGEDNIFGGIDPGPASHVNYLFNYISVDKGLEDLLFSPHSSSSVTRM